MVLEYNGVQLNLLTLDRVDREAVWSSDGMELLYVKWKISASCVYAPGGYQAGTALSFAPNFALAQTELGGNPPQVKLNQESPVTGPITTDIALRTYLFQNRRRLKIWGYDENGKEKVWIESPNPRMIGAEGDAAGGPRIHACNIISNTGLPGNFVVQLEIETCLPPTVSERPLLSHRWQMSAGYDEHHYLTRSTHGEAVFNLSSMEMMKHNPDWYRDFLFHPIPLGFRREIDSVTLSSDGAVLRYEYHDTDSTIIFNNQGTGATEMDIKETVTVMPGVYAPVQAAAAGVGRAAIRGVQAIRQGAGGLIPRIAGNLYRATR